MRYLRNLRINGAFFDAQIFRYVLDGQIFLFHDLEPSVTVMMIDLCSIISVGRPEPAHMCVLPSIALLKVQSPELMFGQRGLGQRYYDLPIDGRSDYIALLSA